MKTPLILLTLSHLSLIVAQASDWLGATELKLKQTSGTTKVSQLLETSTALTVKVFQSERGIGFSASKAGAGSTYGATSNYHSENWGCGKRISATMNTEAEEIFLTLDDYSPASLNASCPRDAVNPPSRLIVTVKEKISAQISVSVLESN